MGMRFRLKRSYPIARWSNVELQLHTLGRVPGSAFEVADATSLQHP